MLTIDLTKTQPMILYQTSLMDLDYDAKTDILRVKWADFEEVNWLELDYNFRVIRDSIKWYFIKHILVDSSSFRKFPDKALLHEVTSTFIQTLYGTSIKKFARLRCGTPEREQLAREISEQMDLENYFFQIKSFSEQTEAMQWLKNDELVYIS